MSLIGPWCVHSSIFGRTYAQGKEQLRPEWSWVSTVKVNYWISIRGEEKKEWRLIVSPAISFRVKQNRNSALLYVLSSYKLLAYDPIDLITMFSCKFIPWIELIRLCYFTLLTCSICIRRSWTNFCSTPPPSSFLLVLLAKLWKVVMDLLIRMRRNGELNSPEDRPHWIKFSCDISTMMTEIVPHSRY